jgi:hypothetical protein
MMICQICQRSFVNIKSLSVHLSKTHKVKTEDYYIDFLGGIKSCCIECGKPTKFASIHIGYSKFCSTYCAQHSSVTKDKIKATCMKNYGVPNALQSEEVKDKIKKTNLEKYGYENAFQSEEVKEKCKKTMIERHGVEHNSQMSSFNDKCKETCMKKWGVEYPAQSTSVKEKTKKTNLERYGVEYTFQSEEIREKGKETCLRKYGTVYPMQSEEVKEKNRNTCILKYGVPYVFQVNEVVEKIKRTWFEKHGCLYPMQSEIVRKRGEETCLKRYGVRNVFQSEEIKKLMEEVSLKRYGTLRPCQSEEVKNKIKNTQFKHFGMHPSQTNEFWIKLKISSLKKYGTEYPFQSEIVKSKIRQTTMERYGSTSAMNCVEIQEKVTKARKKTFYNKLLSSIRLKEKCVPNFELNDYHGVIHKYSWICTVCNTPFDDHVDNGHVPVCPICHPPLSHIVSQQEKEIAEFIKSLGIEIIESDRQILGGKELDIYIPSHNLAIEFDGLYWHSELRGVDKYYHLFKTLKCKGKGIQLIHIFEDEWITQKEIVKSLITAKLGLITNQIDVNSCQLLSVSKESANVFLTENHILGFIDGEHIGLYFNNDLVSLLTVKKSSSKKHDLEILRFCNKLGISIDNGLSRLLQELNNQSMITYVDLRYGDDKLYVDSGFTYLGRTRPSFFYIKKNKKQHRADFRSHIIDEEFDSNLTEWQNMQLSGYDRIWDCGNSIFSIN